MNTVDKSTMPKWNTPKAKFIGVPLEKAIRGSDDTLTVRGYFTSDNKDMSGDIITRSATERAIPSYKRWGNIRYMHLPKPVAKVVRIGEQDGLAWNEVEIKVIDPQAAFEVEQGLLAALSVGILINFDDIDFLEDGGLIINDYLLAEISLVDHPANYDAALTGIKGLFESVASLSPAQALQTLDEMKAAITQGENKMSEEILETEVQQPEVETVQEEKVEEVTEEKAVEETEQPVETEAVQEEVSTEEKTVDETSEEAQPVSEFERLEESIRSLADSFAKSIEELKSSFAALSLAFEESKSVSQETPAEAQVADEQSASDEKSLTETEAVEEEAVEQTGAPANRTAAVLPVELPDETKKAPEEKPKDLRSALRKYLESK